MTLPELPNKRIVLKQKSFKQLELFAFGAEILQGGKGHGFICLGVFVASGLLTEG